VQVIKKYSRGTRGMTLEETNMYPIHSGSHVWNWHWTHVGWRLKRRICTLSTVAVMSGTGIFSCIFEDHRDGGCHLLVRQEIKYPREAFKVAQGSAAPMSASLQLLPMQSVYSICSQSSLNSSILSYHIVLTYIIDTCLPISSQIIVGVTVIYCN